MRPRAGSALFDSAIAIQSDVEVKVRTYNYSSSSTVFAALGLRDPLGQFVSNNIIDAPTVVSISSISTTAIVGTFKGDLQFSNADGTFGKKVSVTNGKFNVKFQ